MTCFGRHLGSIGHYIYINMEVPPKLQEHLMATIIVEYFTLKYDRKQENLYYKEGSHNVAINVNPKTKQLYMPSDFWNIIFI